MKGRLELQRKYEMWLNEFSCSARQHNMKGYERIYEKSSAHHPESFI